MLATHEYMWCRGRRLVLCAVISGAVTVWLKYCRSCNGSICYLEGKPASLWWSTADFNVQRSSIYPHKLIQPVTHTDCYKLSCVPSMVRHWNGFPASMSQAHTVRIFRPAMQAVILSDLLPAHFVIWTLSTLTWQLLSCHIILHMYMYLNSSITALLI